MTDKKIEEMLLGGEDYEKMLKAKIENEFNEVLKENNSLKGKYITDIKSVPPDIIFSKNATYEVINKTSKTRSFINGIQAEGYLGTQFSVRDKLLAGETNSFVNGEIYVKFIKAKV